MRVGATIAGRWWAVQSAAAGQEGKDREADQSYARACDAGDSAACEARGELRQDWEPATVHAPIAEKSLDRACSKGLTRFLNS